MQQEYQTENNQQNESLLPENKIQPPNTIQVSPKPLTQEEALATLPEIPNTMNVVHNLFNTSPKCQSCGGRFYEESIIEIPVLGKFNWKFDFEIPCCCCKYNAFLVGKLAQIFPRRYIRVVPQPKQPEYHGCNNSHGFGGTGYFLENELINFECGQFGRLYIQGVLILEFEQCGKAIEDIALASEGSTMPQMQVYQPNYKYANKITFKAEKNNCPEHPYSMAGCYSICDCKKLIRKFEISGLSQGDCQIINTRTSKQACYKTCGCKDVCCCDSCRYADYPNYQITFNNVTKLDKLAIIMCLMHFIMYNEWEFTSFQGIQLQSQLKNAMGLTCCSIF
ncbi:unnamed protein product (macronuclear) [Paramecium tetraurelia]|uniref:Phospholipid scramblase n=1 Tax=Paramecium tetraurelia TaxID=5888 RepID=A0E4R4_PARTE|nr:uncharacterized protein GSPATT00023456001 [Paramecium tetraurelia]CAK90281.1 unnamed protein product [Paramecium tetraurelia]|eukprot:XP_001457678.1 hypothetical protein (macronuclear) [Paramecium tetraurelia strain d4-2]